MPTPTSSPASSADAAASALRQAQHTVERSRSLQDALVRDAALHRALLAGVRNEEIATITRLESENLELAKVRGRFFAPGAVQR